MGGFRVLGSRGFPCRRAVGALLALLAGTVPPGWATAPSLVQEPWVRLDVRVLSASAGQATLLAEPSLELSALAQGRAQLDLPWPADRTSRLDLALRTDTGPEGETAGTVLVLLAVLDSGDGPPTRIERTLTATDGVTGLIEMSRRGGRALVLAVEVHSGQRLAVRPAAAIGRPVHFHLEVERLQDGRVVPLETNDLNTFVADAVEYSFRRGGGDTEESVRVVLTPIRLEGDLAEVRVEVSGVLPGPAGRFVLNRSESLLITRGATSNFSALSDKTAAGYRFRVTTDF